MQFSIPDKVNQGLMRNQGLYGAVLLALSKFQPWFDDNKLVFFPEYTNHGIEHVNSVLLSVEDLVTDESWSKLSCEDCAAIVLSALLHDCAMHISIDGFRCLVTGRYPKFQSAYFESASDWPDLWERYLQRATRFDERKLLGIFGDTAVVQRPNIQSIDITDRDKRLIGDFLRIYHARLCHEIALSGIPGPTQDRLSISSIERRLLDLIGFVAHSHNLNLREAVEKLSTNNRRSVLGIHAPFIMSVLRITDYVQIDKNRAPADLLKTKALVSPISQLEWQKHASVAPLTQDHDDPFALYADIQPESVAAYVGLKTLLRDIQGELDMSWAVLGEVYGRFKPLDSLGIKIRRIRSNLDYHDEYIKISKPDFIPKELRFSASNAELLRLLVAPLYGNRPEVGVRELLQNAVDACIERRDYEIGVGEAPYSDTSQEDIVINIDIEGDSVATLTVIDHGIGMTLDVLENYFLKIGASFRHSDRWKELHTGLDGKPRVCRIGRFGVGVLAAYLIGEEIEVKTRHVSEHASNGLSFRVRLNDELIEVKSIDTEVGTTITVKITDAEVIKKLSVAKNEYWDHDKSGPAAWDWYCLSWPKLVRRLNGKTLEQAISIDLSNVDTKVWLPLETQHHEWIRWTYSKIRPYSFRNQIICNGIQITDGTEDIESFQLGAGASFHVVDSPSLLMKDSENTFPLTLTRDHVSESILPFHDDLAKVITIDYINGIKSIAKEFPKPSAAAFKSFKKFQVTNHIATAIRDGDIPQPCMWTKDTWLPPDIVLMKHYDVTEVIADGASFAGDQGVTFTRWFVKNSGRHVLWPLDAIQSTKISKSQWINFLFKEGNWRELKWPIVGRRLVVSEASFKELLETQSVSKKTLRSLVVEEKYNEWLILTLGHTKPYKENLHPLLDELSSQKAYGFCLLYLDFIKGQKEITSHIASAWMNGGPQA